MVDRNPPSSVTPAFGKEFRARRVALDLTQADIAATTGIAVSHLSEIENGIVVNLTLSTMHKLAASVGMAIEVKMVELPPKRPRRK